MMESPFVPWASWEVWGFGFVDGFPVEVAEMRVIRMMNETLNVSLTREVK